MSAETKSGCYHCGLPIPGDVDLAVAIDGQPRPMCCHGCQAVAEAIVAGGFADYYHNRDALPESPREALPAALDELRLFDHEAVQRSFVNAPSEHEREAALIIEGITCSACIWLNEQHLSRLPGVTAVSINYSTRRARVRWDPQRVRLSQILEAIAAIGYRAHPYDPARHEALARKERREALWRVFVAGFGAMQVMMYAYPAYVAGDGDMTPDIEQLMRWASLILTLPVVFYSSAPFFRNAWRDIGLRRAGMDVPVALGVLVAFVASVWATFTATGEVYFDSVSMFVFLLLGGRYLEMQARQKAVAATETLARLAPTIAHRLSDYPGRMDVQAIAAVDLSPGQFVLIRPGEVVPADGIVAEGESALDESLLTGESLPLRRGVGDTLIGGATNVDGTLVMRVERVGEQTRLAAILRLMERAAAERPRLVEFADRVAARFVVGILIVAAAVFVAWLFVSPGKALWIAVAVLVVTCPCALSLATPVALTVATGAMARRGLLVTRGHAIETLARATHVVFDKTGTLTNGRLRLARTEPLGNLSEAECLRLAASLEAVSEHPLAVAMRAAVAEDEGDRQRVRDFLVVPGRGVEGTIVGRRLRIGRPDFVGELHDVPLPVSAPAADATPGSVVAMGDEMGWLAVFRFEDSLRDGAADLVRKLKLAGIGVSILSGDAAEAVAAVAASSGIEDWQSGLLPQEKVAAVKRLQASGAVVAMVGDGINDAPVLAQAQVSVAMGQGADLAKVTADCVLIAGGLSPLAGALATSRQAVGVIRQNLSWAVLYNIVAVPMAAVGWVTPWMAGVGMSASSLIVVLNALRLRHHGGD